MKKILLLLFVLSFLSENLYSQREVVIETFDNWGANGLPVGYDWSSDIDINEYRSCINQVDGISGSAIKVSALYSNTSHMVNAVVKTMNFVDEVPESIKITVKNNGSEIKAIYLMVDFFYDLQRVKRHIPYFTNYYYPEWKTFSEYCYIGPPLEFNKMIIAFIPSLNPNNNNEWIIYDEITLIWGSSVELIEPTKDDTWICGENELIKWSADDADDSLKIEYSIDGGVSYTLISDTLKGSDGELEWLVPDIEPTTKARIKITSLKTNDGAESENFRIKSYIITRLDNNGDYITYDVNIDRWNYGNNMNDMFPYSWWFNKFDYQNGIDPFTNDTYPQTFLINLFSNALRSDYPDWISFVNAFSVNTCYVSTTNGVYSPTALLKWLAIKRPWGGSCFGIANANALAFSQRDEFKAHYPDYPNFVDPMGVQSDTNVVKVITEVYTK